MKIQIITAFLVITGILGSCSSYNIDIDACKIWSFNEHGERICIERY